jgi:hypothetical protein
MITTLAFRASPFSSSIKRPRPPRSPSVHQSILHVLETSKSNRAMEDLAYYDEIQELLQGITLDGTPLFLATPPPSQYVVDDFDIPPEDRFTELLPELDADRDQLVDDPAPLPTVEATSTQTSNNLSDPKQKPIAKR